MPVWFQVTLKITVSAATLLLLIYQIDTIRKFWKTNIADKPSKITLYIIIALVLVAGALNVWIDPALEDYNLAIALSDEMQITFDFFSTVFVQLMFLTTLESILSVKMQLKFVRDAEVQTQQQFDERRKKQNSRFNLLLITVGVIDFILLMFVCIEDYHHKSHGDVHLPTGVEFVFQVTTMLSLIGYFGLGGLMQCWFRDRSEVRLK
jgi:hypothetical protein